MVDAWLLILTIIGVFIMIAVNLYLFFIYSHPAEDNKSRVLWFARIVVISGSAIIFSFILLLPLDVANARGSGGGLDTEFIY